MDLLPRSRLFSTCLALISAFFILGVSSAEAATLQISKSGITRRTPLRRDPVTRFWINRSECVADDVLTFPLIIGDYAGSDLEVWASEGTGDCRTRESRTTTNATCWRLYKVTPSTNRPTIEIRVQDIAAKDKPPAEFSVGTSEDCESSSTQAQSITLYFMLIASLDNQAGDTWTSSLDLRGPNAPVNFSVGSGSNQLKGTWDANSDTDVASYRFFCDPPAGTAPDADTSFGAGPGEGGSTPTPTPTPTICHDASTGSDPDADTLDASTDSVCTEAGSGGGSGGSGGTPTATCGSTVLVRDLIPDPDFISKHQCGSNPGKTSTSGPITGLTNYLPTNVAIAALDAAGNIGPLSDPMCGIPEPVNGFDEAYRAAGGNAGDGFCSISYPGSSKSGTIRNLGFAALALFVARYRRRAASRSGVSKS
jgi:hypothetical protein